MFGLTWIGTEVRVSVPAPRKVEWSAQLPEWNLSLARLWFDPSVQLAASATVAPAVSKPGFNTRLLPGALVRVGVFVGMAVAVFVGVLVGLGIRLAVGLLAGKVGTKEVGATEVAVG